MDTTQEMPDRQELEIEQMIAGIKLNGANFVALMHAGAYRVTLRSVLVLNASGTQVPQQLLDELEVNAQKVRQANIDLKEAIRVYDEAHARLKETYLFSRIKRAVRNWYWQT